MSRRFIVADWHIGEDRFQIMQRPFRTRREMIEALVEKHNTVVNPDDLVYMVGDVCYQNTPEFLSEVARFNGKKILIRGNHDRVFTDDELSNYFQEIISEGQGVELNVGEIPCYITHYPSQGVADRFNLVGHIHSAWKYQLNMFNVGVDVNHFYPHNLDEIVPFTFKAVCEFYDEDVWIAYNKINNSYLGLRGKQGYYYYGKV